MPPKNRPWLAAALPLPDDDSGQAGGGTGAPTAPRTLADVLKAHPHLAQELDTRTSEVAAREKDQGRRSGIQEWAKSLGVEDPNIVAEGYRRYAEQQAASMTEAEKAKADAERAKAEAERVLAEAKKERLNALAIKHLTAANATSPELLTASLTALGVTVDSDEEAVKAAVGKLKEQLPGAFAGSASGTPSTGGAGTPPVGSPGASGDGKSKPGAQAAAHIERLTGKKPAHLLK
jgi:hypothetical protein